MAISKIQLSPHLGLDLGSDQTRLYLLGQGVVIDQPSVLALNEKNGKVVAVGQDAAEMEGRVEGPNSPLKLYRPFQQGQVYDNETAQALLRVWLQEILGWRFLFSPVVMVSVPAASTQASRQAVTELLHELGAREVYTMAQPLAAAIGSGVPIADASGTLIAQLGAGVAEVALISLGSLVEFESTLQAGRELDQQLQLTIQENYKATVGLETVKKLKHQLLLLNGSTQTSLVIGQSLSDQSPQEIQVQASQLSPVVKVAADRLVAMIRSLLAKTPPELTADVLDKGVLLAGGLAQLRGLSTYLTQSLGLPVSLVEKPQQVVVDGLGLALEHLDEFKQSFGYMDQIS